MTPSFHDEIAHHERRRMKVLICGGAMVMAGAFTALGMWAGESRLAAKSNAAALASKPRRLSKTERALWLDFPTPAPHEDYDGSNDGKAIALGSIFGSLLIGVSTNPSLSEELLVGAIYGQASVLALGPESEANARATEKIFHRLIGPAFDNTVDYDHSTISELNATDAQALNSTRPLN
ncbi:hypothetical protein THAOC_29901 [Thalassiosira oceanica]|uniref:Uncharacterized protein n=1 Tax=Thalassiosira oceanica TaxID=159749 RepID=K0RB88_THAOC|nr:hypothetical protein THAOC_29901 [Thalassiosira oceanica]|eukprot:EJK50978.1 hypothetical protein THAOC_29901 [Thalassiosira oceanica]